MEAKKKQHVVVKPKKIPKTKQKPKEDALSPEVAFLDSVINDTKTSKLINDIIRQDNDELYIRRLELIKTYWDHSLKHKLSNNQLQFEDLATLDEPHMELVPEQHWPYLKKVQDIARTTAKGLQLATSDSWPCPSCKGPTQFREVQLRSGDEGSSFIIHCPKCNKTVIR